MPSVHIFICIPLPGQERVLLADDLAIEEGCQNRVLICQTFYFQVTTQVGVFQVNLLKIDSHNEKIKDISINGTIALYAGECALGEGRGQSTMTSLYSTSLMVES